MGPTIASVSGRVIRQTIARLGPNIPALLLHSPRVPLLSSFSRPLSPTPANPLHPYIVPLSRFVLRAGLLCSPTFVVLPFVRYHLDLSPIPRLRASRATFVLFLCVSRAVYCVQ